VSTRAVIFVTILICLGLDYLGRTFMGSPRDSWAAAIADIASGIYEQVAWKLSTT
jgi:hypothetical protein